MTGPWPHPKTGILYYRKATPPDILAERNRLAEFGIKVTREIQRSLGTKDRKPAEREYKRVSEEVEAEWDRWRLVLRDGPLVLTPKQEWAIAGDYTKAFLAKHEDDPFAAPVAPPLPEAGNDDRGAVAKTLAKMGAAERSKLKADLAAYLSAEANLKTKLAFRLLEAYPALRQAFGPDFSVMLEEAHGKDTDNALAAHGLSVASETRRIINLRMLDLMGATSRALAARRGGDYSPVAELEKLPPFATCSPKASASGLSLEYLLNHKALSHSIKTKTIEDTRSHLKKFIQFVGHDDARRVTKDDVRKWRDSLRERKDLSPKTISDRYLSALSSVLSHGVKEFDLPVNVASGIKDNRAASPPNGSKGYTEEQAVEILKATFQGSSKDISEPHKRAIKWVPWILAYTGLRVSEVTQFQGKNLREEDDIPYLFITPDDGSTKSGKAWAVGIHKHLIEIGLLDFIRSQGDGPLFYHAYEAGTDLTALDRRHRAKDAGVRVSRWITDELGIAAPHGRANHAWRHLFTTRSRGCGMDKETRDYMMGSRSGTDAREGYGDWPPSVIDAAINSMPRFLVAR
ncbi:MAG: DUF6538 domain-containing protein [Shinella sp.]|uniref:DUF6538 domain-containing protein n=1 Tax=Shinella sp. TaxID=1870904 RepID=UPI003C74153B